MLDAANFNDASPADYALSWRPNPGPQEALVNLPADIDECFFGGARGGGKSDGLLGLILIMALTYGRHFAALVFRREFRQLAGLIERAREIYELHGAVWKDDKQVFRFPNGARVEFAHLDRDRDAEKYQGRSVQLVGFEELPNFPSPGPYLKMKGILRSPHGVPCRLVSTGNPGGPGHSWVKKRFIDRAPRGFEPLAEEFFDPVRKQTVVSRRVFIPSKVHDNPRLDANYVARLHQSGSPELVRAWLEGDWNIIEGAYFPEWGAQHVLRPCPLPAHWKRFRGADWGSAKPFAILWLAIASETWKSPEGRVIPKGALVCYREWYGISTDRQGDWVANTGVRMFAEEVGAGIWERERGNRSAGIPPDPNLGRCFLDPGAFARDGGPSIAERMAKGARSAGGRLLLVRADNKRVAGRGAQGGWDVVRSRLVGAACEDLPDRPVLPMLYVFDSCLHLCRTLPELQHDERNPEDLDSDGEDHAADALRYACMSRPMAAPGKVKPTPPKQLTDFTLDELWADADRQASEVVDRV